MKKLILLFLAISVMGLHFVSSAQKEITLTNIWKDYIFIPKSVPGFASMPHSDYYTTVDLAGIHQFSFETGKEVKMLLSNQMLETASQKKLYMSKLSDYSFDNSETKILLAFDEEYIYRRSTCAYYYVYDLKNNTLTQVSNTDAGKISFADFSADGTKVAFVRDYNLYYYDLANQKEV